MEPITQTYPQKRARKRKVPAELDTAPSFVRPRVGVHTGTHKTLFYTTKFDEDVEKCRGAAEWRVKIEGMKHAPTVYAFFASLDAAMNFAKHRRARPVETPKPRPRKRVRPAPNSPPCAEPPAEPPAEPRTVPLQDLDFASFSEKFLNDDDELLAELEASEERRALLCEETFLECIRVHVQTPTTPLGKRVVCTTPFERVKRSLSFQFH